MEEVMNKELDGRVVIVTGAGGGIGRAASLSLAAAGAKVVVSDRDAKNGAETVELVAAQGGTASFIETDVANEDSVAGMVEKVLTTYGRLDGAFNNAGIAQSHKVLHEISLEEW